MNSTHRNYQEILQIRLKTGNAKRFVKLYVPKDLISFLFFLIQCHKNKNIFICNLQVKIMGSKLNILIYKVLFFT